MSLVGFWDIGRRIHGVTQDWHHLGDRLPVQTPRIVASVFRFAAESRAHTLPEATRHCPS